MDFVFVSSNATQADFDVILTNDGTTILKFNSIILRGNNDSIQNIATAGSIVTASALQNNVNPAWTVSSETWPGNAANVPYIQNGIAFKLNFSSNNQFFLPSNRPVLPIGNPVNIGRFRLTVAGGNWISNSQLNFTWHSLAGVVCENPSGSLVNLTTSPSSITRTVSINQPLNTASNAIGVMSGNDTICSTIGTANIAVSVTGGSGSYQLVYSNGSLNDTIVNYTSGSPITVSPSISTTYTIVSINGDTVGHSGSAIISILSSPPVPDLATLLVVNEECSVNSITAPTATSSCFGVITGTSNITFPITTLGTTAISWTFDDGYGNTSTQTQQVIIIDTNAPVPNLTSLPNLNGNCSITLTPPYATDDCMGLITGTTNVQSPITTQGLSVITWTYNDSNGNTSTQTQNIMINAPNASVTQSGGTLTAISSTASYQWLDCDNNFVFIPGATNQSFSPSILGNYALKATEFGCSDTSMCFIVNITGYEELTQKIEIHVYPNPSNGFFNLEFSGLNHESLEMRIIDLTGRLILSEKYYNIFGAHIQNLDLSDNENGVYLINLIGNKGVILTERIVKK